jgi:AraC-like DNA-binding protein
MQHTPPHRVKTISEFHRWAGLPAPENPLLSIVNFGNLKQSLFRDSISIVSDFYSIAMKRMDGIKYKYGQQLYDFENGGVLFFVSPNQVFSIEVNRDEITERPSGWMMLLHPDLLWNTSLAKTIKQYDFFDYKVSEALFLSEKEEITLNGIVQNIQQECQANIDKYSKQIIVSQIETLLNYSERFYNRQFISREKANHQILDRLEELLNDYFKNDEAVKNGLPTVHFVSEKLNFSPSYLNSLLKALTGLSTQQYIHLKLIEKAKEKLSTTNQSVSEIAYELGFEHSQSFSRLFKSKTNQSPVEFRAGFS